MIPMTERQLQDGIVAAARRLGYLVYHPFDSRRSEPGYPDLTIVGHGKILFIECKSITGRPSAAQWKWIRTIRETGQEVFIVIPADYDDVLAALQEWAS